MAFSDIFPGPRMRAHLMPPDAGLHEQPLSRTKGTSATDGIPTRAAWLAVRLSHLLRPSRTLVFNL
jgi:hypothetical protein